MNLKILDPAIDGIFLHFILLQGFLTSFFIQIINKILIEPVKPF
jgi:hypothetical protein